MIQKTTTKSSVNPVYFSTDVEVLTALKLFRLLESQGDFMKAMQRDAFGVTVIEFSGRLDVETSQAFKALCGKLGQQRVTFNMRKLIFVGSTGIVTFMEALRDSVMLHRAQINFCEVGLDFSKLIMASPLRYVGIYETEQAAVQWHLLNPHHVSQLCEDDFVMQKEEETYDASVLEVEESESPVAS